MERDDAVDEETRAAAAEAGAIGGRAPDDVRDPARVAVEEAGGGEAEGFEQSEQQLVQAAEQGGRLHDPGADAFAPEVESDRAGAEYGEADHERSSEREAQDQ